MSAPDLSTLAARMRFAATVIDEVNTRYELGAYLPWSPAALRERADVLEAEDREGAKHEARVEELARDLFLADFGSGWEEEGTEHLKRPRRETARKLIESGWRKGDPR